MEIIYKILIFINDNKYWMALFSLYSLIIFFFWAFPKIEKKLKENEKVINEKELKLYEGRNYYKKLQRENKELKEQIENKIKNNTNLENKIIELEKKIKSTTNKEKGLDYEIFVAKKYIEKGYEVILYGVLNGRVDYGIDLIAKKENETILIQCKNWQMEQSINQEKVLSYYGRFKRYIDENALDIENTKLRFITPDSKIFKTSAIKIFQDENYINYRYEIIRM